MTIDTGAALLAAALGGAGLLAGSFLGLVSLRLPRGEGFVGGRSRCRGCDQPLPAWRLIPVLSYVAARGRCAGCGAAIPIRYPAMEFACAAIGVCAALTQPSIAAAVLTALLGWQLLLIAVVDGEHFWLPDALTLPLLGTGLLATVTLDRLTPVDSLAGAAVGFGGLWLVARAYRRVRGRDGLGGGDPVLLAAGGAWTGWIGLPSVLLWAALGGLSVVAARLLTGSRVSGSDRLPFGVFLALGVWLTWLLGPLGLAR
ncbi:MAG: prepilin peptidase [Brevundimonas sp.]|uniref:prepilin peptidase n=1 Tax=Brevundimonas sp. TaxID=1871086 RepID=UPI002624A145|nr:A24 family peptidase [Brevundimonas sp.]MDI6624108.1 prepilin peptidase [Brevundimonas sp.]MDQ7812857.1 prepilin peptidase [Brevundimonas sp.]